MTSSDTRIRGMREGTRFSLHPGFAMEASSRRNLLENTGHPLEWWTALLASTGPADARERVAWLKDAHGLGSNYAQWIVERAQRPEPEYDPDALVEAMFAGKKAGLRPLFERLLDEAFALGDDVSVTPGATIVPIRRRFVIAQLKPATATRIDLGLALGDTPASGRLIDTGGLGKKDRITHRIPLAADEEIDDEVMRWLRTAYERDAAQ